MTLSVGAATITFVVQAVSGRPLLAAVVNAVFNGGVVILAGTSLFVAAALVRRVLDDSRVAPWLAGNRTWTWLVVGSVGLALATFAGPPIQDLLWPDERPLFCPAVGDCRFVGGSGDIVLSVAVGIAAYAVGLMLVVGRRTLATRPG